MEQESKRPDLRVIKTKKAIRNAFAQLLAENDIDNITVKDIAQKAIINRKTFYNYYKGVYEIVDEIENEIINNFDEAVQDFNPENPYAIFVKLTAIINSDMDFYKSLLKINGNKNLVKKITELLKLKAQNAFSNLVEIDKSTLAIVLDYTISGMISVYQNWFNSDMRQSIEEISDIVSKICVTGIAGIREAYSKEAKK